MRRSAGSQDRLVSAAVPVRQIRSLLTAGLSLSYIAKEVGYTKAHLHKLSQLAPTWYVRQAADDRKISARRAAEIEALYQREVIRRPRSVRDVGETIDKSYKGMVSSRLSRLAIQGLQAQGWSLGWIATQIGGDSRHLQRILTKHSLVLVKTEEELVALARRVGSSESTEKFALRTKNAAAARGYKPTIYTDALV